MPLHETRTRIQPATDLHNLAKVEWGHAVRPVLSGDKNILVPFPTFPKEAISWWWQVGSSVSLCIYKPFIHLYHCSFAKNHTTNAYTGYECSAQLHSFSIYNSDQMISDPYWPVIPGWFINHEDWDCHQFNASYTAMNAQSPPHIGHYFRRTVIGGETTW